MQLAKDFLMSILSKLTWKHVTVICMGPAIDFPNLTIIRNK